MSSQHLNKVQWVRFRNDSGDVIPGGAVIKLTGFEADDENPFFKAEQSDAFGAQASHAINDNYSVGVDRYGLCCLGQLIPAVCESTDGTPAFGEVWGPRAGGWNLRKNTGGFRIMSEGYVGDESKTRALVLPEPWWRFRGTLVADSLKGTTATVNVFSLASDAYSDTGVDITNVYNELQDLTAGDAVYCEYEVNGASFRWRIYAWEC